MITAFSYFKTIGERGLIVCIQKLEGKQNLAGRYISAHVKERLF